MLCQEQTQWYSLPHYAAVPVYMQEQENVITHLSAIIKATATWEIRGTTCWFFPIEYFFVNGTLNIHLYILVAQASY